MNEQNPIPLLLTSALAVFGVYVAFLLGVLIERRRWRDYHRTVMAAMEADHSPTQPPVLYCSQGYDYEQATGQADDAWIDEIESKVTK